MEQLLPKPAHYNKECQIKAWDWLQWTDKRGRSQKTSSCNISLLSPYRTNRSTQTMFNDSSSRKHGSEWITVQVNAQNNKKIWL